MASVYCTSCKAKITQQDVTCPRCGSPTSRTIPIVLCIVASLACLWLYSAYHQSTDLYEREVPFSIKNTPDPSHIGMSEE